MPYRSFIFIFPRPSFDGEIKGKKSASLPFLLETTNTNFFSTDTSYNLTICPQVFGLNSTLSLNTSNIHPPSYSVTQILAASVLSSPDGVPHGLLALSASNGHSFNYDFYLRIFMKSYQSTVISSSECHNSSSEIIFLQQQQYSITDVIPRTLVNLLGSPIIRQW